MRKVGGESRKTYQEKLDNGFFEKYMSGIGLDIGFSGYEPDVVPILETAIGVDKNYPGYNGLKLPFEDNSQDYIYSSHMLEHVEDYKTVIKDWMRVLKPGGFIITVVPHRDLYEKKLTLPSNFNADHKRLYTASSLLKEFEDSLEINSYRVRHLHENDKGHNYQHPLNIHGVWEYEIEVVIQKL